MRLVVGLFAMFLTASVAHADEAKVPESPEAKPETTRVKVPLRLVKVLADSRQVLLFDKTKGSHVLAEVGQTIDGYTVDDIDEDEVTLVTATGKEVVLTLPSPPAAAAPEPAAKKPATRAPAKAVLVPADPYAAAGTEAPVDPYAEPVVRSASLLPALGGELGSAPIVEPAPAVTPPTGPAFAPTSAAAPAPKATTKPDPYADITVPDGPAKAAPDFVADATEVDGVIVPSPVPTAKPKAIVVPAAPAVDPDAPVITPTVLSRTELNGALGDFNKLSSMLRGSFTKDGARLEMVAPNSVFAKAGLRAGDVVTTVDNAPIRSIDDAAELYVRAPQTRAANIQILRAGKPMTLRVLMQ